MINKPLFFISPLTSHIYVLYNINGENFFDFVPQMHIGAQLNTKQKNPY